MDAWDGSGDSGIGALECTGDSCIGTSDCTGALLFLHLITKRLCLNTGHITENLQKMSTVA